MGENTLPTHRESPQWGHRGMPWIRVVFLLLIIFAPCATEALRLPSFSKTSGTVRSEIAPIQLPTSSPKYYWDLSRVAFSLLPLAPGARRKTIFSEVVKGSVWTADQLQGIVNVNVPVRGVIIRLKSGGLLVYNPVAPTGEVLSYMRELEEAHGPVRHIVLGSLGLEHKALCGPFTRYFPQAQCWQQPGQWSFPANLPSFFFGFPLRRLRDIPADGTNPWAEDFDIAVLGPLKFKSVGGFGETAMFHRQSKTLLVTDAILKVGSVAPPIILEDPRAVLFHSRDDMLDAVRDTEEARRIGWRRMVLFGLFFFPSGIRVSGIVETFKKLPDVDPAARLLGVGALPAAGLYPWSWQPRGEEKNFAALQEGLLVAPILRKLILNREPERVLKWVDAICQWGFTRIIPSHFENDVRATAKDVRLAYQFLQPRTRGARAAAGARGLREDYSLLNTLSEVFTRLGVVAPPQVTES